MPLKQDENGGGTEKDGSISTMYCSHCYVQWVFISPDMTVEQMQKLVDEVLKNEIKMRWFLRKLAVKQTPKLARWKNIKK